MIKPLVRKSSCSSSQDTISLYHAYRRRYCIIYIKGFRDYSFPFLLKIIAQPFSYPLTPRKHSPNVSCVTYTMTWTPGFSSNCTKFWFNALNSVSTICKTRERVHGQTWKVTALPYESTDKKKNKFIHKMWTSLSTWCSHPAEFHETQKWKDRKRYVKKERAAFQRSPWMRALTDIVFHSTSSLELFYPCLYNQRPVVGSMKECQLIISSLIWSGNTLGIEAPARIKAHADSHPNPLHILFNRQWEANIKEEAASFYGIIFPLYFFYSKSPNT